MTMRRPMRACLILATMLLIALSTPLAQADPVPAPAPLAPEERVADPALEARLRALELELRCLVCQNQTLADSNAGLAEDLRREIRARAVAGASDAEIKQFLHDRYGDFVLYRPPLEPATWLLWFGPFVLLIVTAGGLAWRIRARRAEPDANSTLTESRRASVEQLLR
jgi:cytochrome c-type biogenesis protein CcmH